MDAADAAAPRGGIPAQTRWLLLAAAGIVVATVAVALSDFPELAKRIFSDLTQLAAAVVATVACAIVARRASGRRRVAWTFLAMAAGSWALGQLLWTYFELIARIETPIPSLADIAYLSYIPFAAIGFVILAHRPGSGSASAVGTIFDGLLVALSVFLLAWPSFLHGFFRDPANVGASVLSVVYLAADILLLSLAVVTWLRAASRARPALLGLLVAFALVGVADVGLAIGIFGQGYSTGGLTDAGWSAGLLALAAVAFLRPVEARGLRPPGALEQSIPLVGLVLGISTYLVFPLHGSLDYAVQGSGILLLSAFAVVRQILSVREQGRLVGERIALGDTLAATQRAAGVGSWEFDLATGRARIPRETYDVLGLPPREGSDMDALLRLVSPEMGGTAEQFLASIVSGQLRGPVDLEILRPDGSRGWFTARYEAVRDAAGTITAVRGLLVDVTERKQTELALVERERTLAVAQRVGHVGSWEIDLATGKLTASAETLRIAGMSADELGGIEESLQRIHPDDRDRVRGMLEDAALVDHASGDARVQLPDGGTRWVYFVVESEKDATGRPLRILGFVQDITERKLAELAERELRDQLASAHRIARLGSWTWDPASDARQWSEETYRIMGRDPALGPPTTEELRRMHTPEGFAAIERVHTRTLATGITEDVDVEVIAPDGKRRWIAVHAEVDQDATGRSTGLLGAILDITARKEAELAHEESAALTNAIFDSIPAMVIVTDEAGNLVRWNRALTRVAGYADDDLATMNGIDFVPDAEKERFAATFQEVLRSGRSNIEVPTVYKDGRVREVLITGQRFGDPAHPSVVGIAIDLTERKRAELALRRNERLASLGTLVAGIAHEINNPLMYIQGSVEMIQDSAKTLSAADPAHAEDLDTIATDAATAMRGLERIALITKGLRQVARISGSARAPESIDALVAGVLPVASPRISPSVTVATDFRTHHAIECSAGEISQVILNLVLNAAEAMGEKGGALSIATFEDESGVNLEVTDTGPGIPLDKQAQLFTPFFTTKPQGTGLGLSISRSIVADHGGDISFRSTPGAGTTFRVRLPAIAEKAKKATS